MLFNSLDYLLFLPIVFVVYWTLNKNLKVQNLFLLASSYFFYGCWDYRFLGLIFLSTVSDFIIGEQLYRSEDEKKRKQYLQLSLFINLGILFVFKYYDFFVSEFTSFLAMFGFEGSISTLNIILPVGISFYTFQTLSYTIDIYYRKLEPEKDFTRFALFVSFFPQLVAGPIERAKNLLPQVRTRRKPEYERFASGARLIVWGIFKKVVIADRLAYFVDMVFANPDTYGGVATIIASIFFVFQIYCDFSAYSDIAIGSARILGFDLMDNFKNPLFSKNVSELWRTWHISLSTWVRDYVYIPLSFKYRDYGTWAFQMANFMTFTLIGVWHGANWTFIVFGIFHGFAILYESLTKKRRKKIFKKYNKQAVALFSIIITFTFWTFTLIIFRVQHLSEAVVILKNIFTIGSDIAFLSANYTLSSLIDAVSVPTAIEFVLSCGFILLLMIIESIERAKNKKVEDLIAQNALVIRWFIYFSLVLLIILFGIRDTQNEFIYFQF